MARTPSNMVKLGTLAPNFELLNTTNDELVSSEHIFNKNGTIVMFICNHCPFVIHVLDEIISISNKFKDEISFQNPIGLVNFLIYRHFSNQIIIT